MDSYFFALICATSEATQFLHEHCESFQGEMIFFMTKNPKLLCCYYFHYVIFYHFLFVMSGHMSSLLRCTVL